MADSFAATVRRNAYVDSVTLLQVSSEVLSLPGVVDAALVMATDLNRQVLQEAGLLVDDAQTAGPNDLVIAVRASDDAAANAAVQHGAGQLAWARLPPGPPHAPSAAPPASTRKQIWRSSPCLARTRPTKPARPWR